MKNNIFLHTLFIFIFATILVAENSFPNIGQGQVYNLSFLFLILLISYKFVIKFEEVFLYGFLLDSISSNFPFGFFSVIFLLYTLVIKTVNFGSFNEILFIIIYLGHFIITSVFLNSFSLFALFLNLIFYLVFRFVLIIILKR